MMYKEPLTIAIMRECAEYDTYTANFLSEYDAAINAARFDAFEEAREAFNHTLGNLDNPYYKTEYISD